MIYPASQIGRVSRYDGSPPDAAGDLALDLDSGVLMVASGQPPCWVVASGAGSTEESTWICAYCDRDNDHHTECAGCGAPRGLQP